VTLRLVCVVRICIPTAEHSKPGCIAGSVIGGHNVHMPGMSGAGSCARLAPTINLPKIVMLYR